jgi:hypothetical protein
VTDGGKQGGGGWGGIRTPGEREPTPVFKTGALNHSATHPTRYFNYLACRIIGTEPESAPNLATEARRQPPPTPLGTWCEANLDGVGGGPLNLIEQVGIDLQHRGRIGMTPATTDLDHATPVPNEGRGMRAPQGAKPDLGNPRATDTHLSAPRQVVGQHGRGPDRRKPGRWAQAYRGTSVSATQAAGAGDRRGLLRLAAARRSCACRVWSWAA